MLQNNNVLRYRPGWCHYRKRASFIGLTLIGEGKGRGNEGRKEKGKEKGHIKGIGNTTYIAYWLKLFLTHTLVIGSFSCFIPKASPFYWISHPLLLAIRRASITRKRDGDVGKV